MSGSGSSGGVTVSPSRECGEGGEECRVLPSLPTDQETSGTSKG